MNRERTLIIFKPDCMEKRLVGTVLSRFEQAGFDIVACKMLRLTKEQLRTHYAHVITMPFYPALEEFMGLRPVIVLALEGEAAVQRVRDLLGPTDSRKAVTGTIRGDFGVDTRINILHASDSVESGLAETVRFFGPDEIFRV